MSAHAKEPTRIPIDKAVPRLGDALAYYEHSDVGRCLERYKRMTGHDPHIYESTIEACRTFVKVPNEPFRKPYLQMRKADEGHWADLFREELHAIRAYRLSWAGKPTRVGPEPLESRDLSDYMRDVLGLKTRKNSNGG